MLDPRLNFFVGDNGAGKTSILESLVVLAKGRSFRSGQLGALIGPEEERFRVVAHTSSEREGEQTLGIERSAEDWSARRNRTDVTQLSDLAVFLPLVLIEPNSHLLVSGPPEGRRRFMDWGVFHVEQDHLLAWRRYARALKQRNAALRQRSAAVVESLEPQLSELGERIHQARQRHCARLFEELENTLGLLSPGLGVLKADYRRGWTGGSLQSALAGARDRDMDRGGTGPGPHRGDFSLDREGGPAKDTLSRGEQKILATALLLAQARLMVDAGKTPLLLLDDTASEFDETHLGRVMSLVQKLGAQAWVTGTDIGPYSGLEEQCTVFHVEQGQLSAITAD